MIGVYACAGIFWKQLKEKNPDIIKENAIYYTFWLNYKTLALLLNRKKLKQAVIVSRIHGVDMFCERIPCEWHPFRRFMGNKLDNLIFVSNDGYNYYCERFMDGEKPDNFNICRLGVEQKNSMNPENRSGIFRLVSCSHIINIKRINLIIEALAILPKTKKIEWIHFGDGELTAEMKELACIKLTGKENISYEFRGYVPNKELLQFYRDTPVDCFITTSSTEGLPVSIEEALSFGIPIIGTDVGGISETINENGILLSSNPDIQEIGEAILKIYDEPINKIRKYRENSYKIWERDFNSEKNNKNLRILLEGKINHASDAYI
ncbi:MAG: glycosyltransferase [Lachnospiraceae bacterium]|nr:glycosyltransferase [Lachnospiraceae bacterium]